MNKRKSIPAYRTHRYHKFYLKITSVVVLAFSPIFFLGTLPETSEPARWTLDLVSWPLDGAQVYTEPTTRFLSALLGGFLMGWGITIWLLSAWVYDKAPEETRKAVVIGAIAWFVLDSAGSVTSGNASNAVFNIIVLLIAVGPLWTPAKG